MEDLEKAEKFERDKNWQEVKYYSALAASKLKQLNDPPIDDISKALRFQFNALQFMGQYREALVCAREWYCLWPQRKKNPPAVMAAFALIQSCILTNEFFDAEYYARTLFKAITSSEDNQIPEIERRPYISRAALELSRAIVSLAESGGILPEEKHTLGQEAIMLARRALAIDAQLFGADSHEVGFDKAALGHALEYLVVNSDDVESILLFEQAIAIFSRVEGRLSLNVAVNERYVGMAYEARSKIINDRDRRKATLELALSRYYEASRIYRAINRLDKALDVDRDILRIEQPFQATLRWIELIFVFATMLYIMYSYLSPMVLNSIGCIFVISLIGFLMHRRKRPRLRRNA